MIRKAFAFLAIVGCTCVIEAQRRHGTTDTVEINLLENCNVQEIWVVRDGLDRARIKATQPDRQKQPCRWTATLPKPQKYHTNTSSFSLRLTGKGRSECLKAKWDDKSRAGFLTYSCCPGGDAFKVIVSSESPIDYARSVRQCIEKGQVWGTGPEEDRTIHDVQFGIENLRVQIVERKPAACGLIVHRLAFMRNIQKQLLAEDSSPVLTSIEPITHEVATAALAEQDVRGENCHATVLSVPNIEVTEKLAFKKLSIRVN